MWPDTDTDTETDTETSPSREHASVYRQTLMMTAAVVLTAAVGGCALAPRPGPQTAAHHAHASKRHHAGRGRHHKHQHQNARQAAAVRVLAEPQAGIGPIYRLITRARATRST